MKIKLLRVTNLQKVKHIEIEPKDNVIVIAGRNESGKTSVLKAILWAMTGKTGMKGVNKPIREGEEEAEVVLEIDNFIVSRYWKNNKTSKLTIVDKNVGIIPKSPQSVLDSFIGKLAFDPLEFSQLDSREQRDLLFEALGLKKILKKIDEKRNFFYEKRGVINKDIKTFEGQLKGLKQPKKDLPKKIISISDLSKKLEKSKEFNYELDLYKNKIKENLEAIKNLKFELKNRETDIKILKEKVKGLKPLNTVLLREDIENAEKLNTEIREAEKYIQIEKYKIEKEAESKKLTKDITDLDKNKLKLLKEKEMPIKGLTIDEVEVSYKNIPFNQLSSSEQLKVSMAMAMAMNPKLRVIRITDGSLLDDDNMKVIEDMASKFDYQIWLERVAVDEFADIVLVDGEIKNEF